MYLYSSIYFDTNYISITRTVNRLWLVFFSEGVVMHGINFHQKLSSGTWAVSKTYWSRMPIIEVWFSAQIHRIRFSSDFFVVAAQNPWGSTEQSLGTTDPEYNISPRTGKRARFRTLYDVYAIRQQQLQSACHSSYAQ